MSEGRDAELHSTFLHGAGAPCVGNRPSRGLWGLGEDRRLVWVCFTAHPTAVCGLSWHRAGAEGLGEEPRLNSVRHGVACSRAAAACMSGAFLQKCTEL